MTTLAIPGSSTSIRLLSASGTAAPPLPALSDVGVAQEVDALGIDGAVSVWIDERWS